MATVNIGPKIGIDGEREYRKQINDLITANKLFSAELKELESDFASEASAMEKNRKKSELLEKSIKNQEKAVEELEKGLEAAEKKYGENATETQKWKTSVSNAKAELNRLRSELQKIPKPITQIGKSMQEAGKKMQKVGDSMSKYVTAPIVAVGAASIAAFKEVDKGMDAVAKATGATGQELTGLQNSVKEIATTIPTSFETAGEAVGTVATRFGLTGKACEELSSQFIKFAKVNDMDVTTSIEGTQKVMAAFGVDTKDASKLLDAMNKTGQKTGISMDTLQTSMVKNAAALQDMGMDAYQAASFLGEVETSGANTDTVMQGLSKALTNAAEDGKTLPQALSDFQGIMNSTASDQEKLNAAVDLFGKKAGPAIYEACKSGSLSFESLSQDASEYLGSVESTFENVLDPTDRFQIAMNDLKLLGSEVGKSLLTAAAPAIEDIGGKLKTAAEWFGSLDESQQTFAVNVAAALAVSGPVMSAIGRLTTGIGMVVAKIGEWEAIPTLMSTLLTNPVGLAILGVTGLIAAIGLIDSSAGYVNEDLLEMVSNTESAITAMDEATGTLSQTLSDAEEEIGDINSKADLAEDLITELAALESQTNRTAEQQGRMRTIVGELNGLYPELGLAINSSTGELNKSTEEIKAYVDQARKVKLVEAYQKAASKGYEALAEAGIALSNARKQQADNLETINGLEEEHARLAGLSADANGAYVDSAGNFVMSSDEMTTALENLELDIEQAKSEQENLNTATDEAQTAYENAEQQIVDYEQAATDTAAELDAMTSSTEENTDAMEDNTAAATGNAAAVESWASRLSSNAATIGVALANAITAWDDLYQSTKDSIDKQIGLFDEWKQDSEVTFETISKNLQSQITGMTSYAGNMKKLAKAAAESSDPHFKAIVQSIAGMGVEGAAYADALVKAMEGDSESFNQYLSQFGDTYIPAKDELAYWLAFVENDFSSGIGDGMTIAKNALDTVFGPDALQNGMKNFGDMIMGAVNKNKELETSAKQTGKAAETAAKQAGTTLETSTKTSTDTAKNYAMKEINDMPLEPDVDKIDVPTTVTEFAKQVITSGVSGVHGNVSKVTGGAAAGKAAKSEIEGKIDNMSGKVTAVTVAATALSNIKSAVSNFLQNNPITAWINANVTKHAEGGFTYQQQLSWLSEGNQPEVVIPLATAKRDRALTLYQETGQILGVASPTVSTMTVPDASAKTERLQVNVNTEQMYAAVAAAVRQGLASEEFKLYIGEREAGRILRGMGVQFA